ncbi:MAG: hypothetical protein PVG41_14970 [Desulfobacteraceae bacterium]|jgi:hypothetical protein
MDFSNIANNKSWTVGAFGHRVLVTRGKDLYAYSQCYQLLNTLKNRFEGLTALTPAAEGADTIFSEAALAAGVPVEMIQPFSNYDQDFLSLESKERYDRLKKNVKTKIHVHFKDRCLAAYRKAMEWVVFRSNLIIAVWDGRQQGVDGGTWQAVQLAQSLSKPLIHIDYRNNKTCAYGNSKNGYGFRGVVSLNNFHTLF